MDSDGWKSSLISFGIAVARTEQHPLKDREREQTMWVVISLTQSMTEKLELLTDEISH
jgi:hypothetical protein